MRRFFLRIANLFRKPSAERELAREIDSHLALLQEDSERRGLPPGEARLAALRAYGGVEQAKELHREARSFLWIEQFFKDVGYGARNLLSSPGFTLTAVAALALGIGATTAIFSIVNLVALKPLPVPDADHSVVLLTTNPSDGEDNLGNMGASPAKVAFWRSQSSVIEDVSPILGGVMNYTGGEVVEQWHSMQISAETFRLFGLQVVCGRVFTREEDLPEGPPVVVISQGLWKRRFHGDPGVLGQKVSLSGNPYTVIGVVTDSPGLMEFGDPTTDVYVPFQIDPNTNDLGSYFVVAAHLKPGVTVAQAKSRLKTVSADYRAKFPADLGPKDTFSVALFRDAMVSDARTLLLVLAGAVGLVLLIACANVANLQLVRANGRRREIGIRVAVGAGRWRVIRQLLTESMLLALGGGAFGLLLGHFGIRALLAANDTDLPVIGNVSIDWRVMGFAVAISLLTGIVFGSFPALQGSRVDLNSILKDGGRWGTGLRQNKARALLVISEVSLTVILLVGSALLIRTFVALYRVNRGFETKNVVTLPTSLNAQQYSKAQSTAEMFRTGLEHIRSLPGVLSASATCCVPLLGAYGLPFDVVGRPRGGDPHSGGAGWSAVSPGFFETFQIPLKRGRTFTERDDGKSPAVVVINEQMAKQYWKDSDPLNSEIVIGKGVEKDLEGDPRRQIIGIVGNVRDQGLNNEPRPTMYVPQAQLPDAMNANFFRRSSAWVVRTKAEPHALVPAIRDQLRQATGLPAGEVRSMEEIVRLSTGGQRFNMLVMTIFGCAALLLAAIGIYGLMAYAVEQRTQEIGIRLALGAEASQVRNMVMRHGMVLALVGVALGLGAAWGVARALESLLFGVKARDPMVFVAVPIVLTVVALLAVWLPARRALRIDPMEALRYE